MRASTKIFRDVYVKQDSSKAEYNTFDGSQARGRDWTPSAQCESFYAPQIGLFCYQALDLHSA